MRQRHAPALLAYQRIPLVRGTRTRGKLRKRVTRQDAYSYWPITLVRGDESLRAAPRAPYIRLSPSFIATSTAVLFLLYDRTRLIWQRGTQRESRNSREGVKSRKGESRKRIMHVSIAVMRRSVSPLDGFTVCLLNSAQLLNLLIFSDSNASKTASPFNWQQDCIHKLGLRTRRRLVVLNSYV
jgi:hypothetical protein